MKQQLLITNSAVRTKPSFQNALVWMLLFSYFGVNLNAQTTAENFIKTTTYKKPFADPDKALVEITYIDGLGRPKQKIAHQQSGQGGDIITHIAYDSLGRQLKEFLPYARPSSSLAFDINGFDSTTDFYSDPTNGPTTLNPWSEKFYEESPLNRILKQAAPGNDWAMGSDHEIKYSYETNNASEVHHFSVAFQGGGACARV